MASRDYAELILDNLIDLKEDGSFRLDLDYFDYCTGLTHDERAASMRCSAGRRASPRNCSTQRHMDLAASIQAVTEEVVLRLTRSLAAETRHARISASPAASRSTASPTARSCATGASSNIWIQPAAGDAGGALGAALAAYHHAPGQAAPRDAGAADAMQGAYLGPAFAQADIESRLARSRRAFHELVDDDGS